MVHKRVDIRNELADPDSGLFVVFLGVREAGGAGGMRAGCVRSVGNCGAARFEIGVGLANGVIAFILGLAVVYLFDGDLGLGRMGRCGLSGLELLAVRGSHCEVSVLKCCFWCETLKVRCSEEEAVDLQTQDADADVGWK